MKNNSAFIAIAFLSVFFIACGKDSRQRQNRIDNYIQQRIENHTRLAQEKCYNNIEKAAAKAVDRYIQENEASILQRNRTDHLPPKPIKPVRKRIKDTLKLGPILDSLEKG